MLENLLPGCGDNPLQVTIQQVGKLEEWYCLLPDLRIGLTMPEVAFECQLLELLVYYDVPDCTEQDVGGGGRFTM